MIRTRSIIQRLNPANVFGAIQCLCRQEALFADDEWFWSVDPAQAFVFDTREEAATKAEGLPYALDDDANSKLWPFAVVLGSAQLAEERETRQRSRDAALDGTVERFKVSPEQAFANLEKRHLA